MIDFLPSVLQYQIIFKKATLLPCIGEVKSDYWAVVVVLTNTMITSILMIVVILVAFLLGQQTWLK